MFLKFENTLFILKITVSRMSLHRRDRDVTNAKQPQHTSLRLLVNENPPVHILHAAIGSDFCAAHELQHAAQLGFEQKRSAFGCRCHTIYGRPGRHKQTRFGVPYLRPQLPFNRMECIGWISVPVSPVLGNNE